MYKLQNRSIKRLLDGASIPLAVGNRDYDEYLLWLSQGGIPEPEFTDEELAQQELSKKIQEAKDYLNNTDHKMFTNYEPKVDEDLEGIKVKRKEARDFIRSN